MAEAQETIADIIAWLRKPREGENAYLTLWRDEIADRIEAAHKRERGDAAKLREALVQVQKKIKYLIGNLTVPNSLVASRMEINGIINAALAAPPRNCDVGTMEEQTKRFFALCDSNKCSSCPCKSTPKTDCALIWAQMPYEEGGAK